MFLRILSQAIAVIFAASVQIAFIGSLPGFLSAFSPYIVILVFILMLSGHKQALLWGLGMGICLDFFSFSFFGAQTISIAAAVLFGRYLLSDFFTNRSFYSFPAVTFFVSLPQKALYLAADYAYNRIISGDSRLILDRSALLALLFAVLLEMAAAAALLYAMAFFSPKLKPAFLNKKRYGF